MNYIYSILMFATMGTISILFGKPNGTNIELTFFVIAVILFITTFIFFLTMVFHNMKHKQEFREEIVRYYRSVRELKAYEDSFDKLKTELAKYMTQNYPDYEKEVFSKMSPDELKEVSVLMVKYPELNYNTIMHEFIRNLIKMSDQILSQRTSILYKLDSIECAKQNPWILGKAKVPQQILNEITNNLTTLP